MKKGLSLFLILVFVRTSVFAHSGGFGTGQYGGSQVCPFPFGTPPGIQDVSDEISDEQEKMRDIDENISELNKDKREAKEDVKYAEEKLKRAFKSSVLDGIRDHFNQGLTCGDYNYHEKDHFGIPDDVCTKYGEGVNASKSSGGAPGSDSSDYERCMSVKGTSEKSCKALSNKVEPSSSSSTPDSKSGETVTTLPADSSTTPSEAVAKGKENSTPIPPQATVAPLTPAPNAAPTTTPQSGAADPALGSASPPSKSPVAETRDGKPAVAGTPAPEKQAAGKPPVKKAQNASKTNKESVDAINKQLDPNAKKNAQARKKATNNKEVASAPKGKGKTSRTTVQSEGDVRVLKPIPGKSGECTVWETDSTGASVRVGEAACLTDTGAWYDWIKDGVKKLFGSDDQDRAIASVETKSDYNGMDIGTVQALCRTKPIPRGTSIDGWRNTCYGGLEKNDYGKLCEVGHYSRQQTPEANRVSPADCRSSLAKYKKALDDLKKAEDAIQTQKDFKVAIKERMRDLKRQYNREYRDAMTEAQDCPSCSFKKSWSKADTMDKIGYGINALMPLMIMGGGAALNYKFGSDYMDNAAKLGYLTGPQPSFLSYGWPYLMAGLYGSVQAGMTGSFGCSGGMGAGGMGGMNGGMGPYGMMSPYGMGNMYGGAGGAFGMPPGFGGGGGFGGGMFMPGMGPYGMPSPFGAINPFFGGGFAGAGGFAMGGGMMMPGMMGMMMPGMMGMMMPMGGMVMGGMGGMAMGGGMMMPGMMGMMMPMGGMVMGGMGGMVMGGMGGMAMAGGMMMPGGGMMGMDMMMGMQMQQQLMQQQAQQYQMYSQFMMQQQQRQAARYRVITNLTQELTMLQMRIQQVSMGMDGGMGMGMGGGIGIGGGISMGGGIGFGGGIGGGLGPYGPMGGPPPYMPPMPRPGVGFPGAPGGVIGYGASGR